MFRLLATRYINQSGLSRIRPLSSDLLSGGDADPPSRQPKPSSSPSSPQPTYVDDSDIMLHSKRHTHRYSLTVLPSHQTGLEIIHNGVFNKGVAFTERERDRFGLRGLLPPQILTLEDQLKRVYKSFLASGRGVHDESRGSQPVDRMSQHLFLTSLQDRNEVLFYHLIVRYIEEMAPVIYTPTVGDACLNAQYLYRRPRGMHFSLEDKGDIFGVLQNWPHDDVEIVVVTDGSRILGLGDLGVQGMGIPIGKLSLYAAAGGFHPVNCLPVVLDVGTNNEKLLKDPLYLGLRRRRAEGPEYLQFVDEFMGAIARRFPRAIIQFEDFRNPYAEMLLTRYRNVYRMFNDDIQGTGSVTLAGIVAALRRTNVPLPECRIVCLGAGSAGLGVCNSIVYAMTQMGLTREQALERFWLVDDKGLLTRNRATLQFGQDNFARIDDKSRVLEGAGLAQVVDQFKPHILLGLSGAGGSFTPTVLKTMASHVDEPIIFAMSNPTRCSECTAEEAYKHTDGRAIFASGSPFAPVTLKTSRGERSFAPSQANNMFIFPGVGLGAIVGNVRHINDRMFYQSAMALAASVSPEHLAQGQVFPSIRDIRTVSVLVAAAVSTTAQEDNLTTKKSSDWKRAMSDYMWYPQYSPLVWPFKRTATEGSQSTEESH